MPIITHCPGCSKRYQLDDRMAGKRARCKECTMEFRIPVEEEPMPVPKPAPRPATFDEDDLPPPRRAEARPGPRRRKPAAQLPATLTAGLGSGGFLGAAAVVGLIGIAIFAAAYLWAKGHRAEGGDEPDVRLIVNDVPSFEAYQVIGEKVKAMIVSDGNHSFRSSYSSAEGARYELSPVPDVKSFAARITFGRVTNTSGNEITVAAAPVTAGEIAAYKDPGRGAKDFRPAGQRGFDVPPAGQQGFDIPPAGQQGFDIPPADQAPAEGAPPASADENPFRPKKPSPSADDNPFRRK